MQKKSTHKVKIIVAAVIRKGEKYLMVREGKKKGQLWSPAQGKVDHGEDLIKAVIREVKEETNLDFKPNKILAPIIVREHSERGVISLKFFFEGSWNGVPKPMNEVEKIEFFGLEEMKRIKLRTPEMKKFVGKIDPERRLPLSVLQTFITDKR